jgi:hypothetical protein
MSAKYANHITQEAYNIIVPLLGDIMTQNVLKAQIKRIGKTEDSITRDDLPKLATTIKSGLSIFLGSDAANNISLKIQNIKR